MFQFLDGSILPDNKIVVVAAEEPTMLGVLSSKIHMVWAADMGPKSSLV